MTEDISAGCKACVYVLLITFIMTGRHLHDHSQLCGVAINPIYTIYTAFRLLLLASTPPNNMNILCLTTFSSQVELIPPKALESFFF